MEVLSAGESALVHKLPKDSAGHKGGSGSVNARENLKQLMRAVS